MDTNSNLVNEVDMICQIMKSALFDITQTTSETLSPLRMFQIVGSPTMRREVPRDEIFIAANVTRKLHR